MQLILNRNKLFIFVFALLLIFTFSSVGVAISKHVCLSEGITEISVTGVSTCAEHGGKTAAKNCCKKPTEQSNKKQDCCDEDFVYAVLDIVKKHEENLQEKILFTPATLVLSFVYSDNILTDHSGTVIYALPPLLYSSVISFLSLVSVFRL
jgi:hypothetical protein